MCLNQTRPQAQLCHNIKRLKHKAKIKTVFICTHLPVFEAFSVDEEGVASQQFGRQQPAHAHSAQASVLRQPAAARIVSGHHHCFDAHNVAVTATHQRQTW